MNPRYARLRRQVIQVYIWFVLATGLISSSSVISLIDCPFPGFTMFFQGEIGAWFVDTNPAWWPGVSNGEFDNGQLVLSFAGQPGNKFGLNSARIYEQAAQTDGYVELVTDSWGKAIYHRLPLIPFTWHHFFDLKSYDIISGLSLWLLAVAMFRVYRDDEVIFIFILATLSLALARWNSIPADFTLWPIIPQLLTYSYIIFGGALIGALVLHLSLLFPSPIAFRPTWLILGIYLIALLLILAYSGAKVLLYSENINALEKLLDTIGFRGLYYYGLLGMAALLARLFYEAIWGKTKRIRRMTLITLLGFLVGLIFLLPSILNRLGLVPFDPFKAWLDLRYLYLLFPAVAGFIILRYRAFQEINLLFMLVPALALSGLLASVAASLLQQLFGEALLPPTVRSMLFFIIFLFILGTAVLFLFQTAWRGFFARILQGDDYTLTGLQQLNQALNQYASPQQMAQTIAQSLVAEMGLQHTAVWLKETSANHYQLQGTAGTNIPLPPQLTITHDDLAQLLDGQPRYLADSRPLNFAPALAHLNPTEIILPLSFSDDLLGLLYLGTRWDEEIFNNRDLIIWELLGQQIAQFLLTARHMTELQTIPRVIALAQEEERFRLAQELHDTTQQVLGRLPLFLEASLNLIGQDEVEAERLLRLCIQDVVREARNVRAIRNSLAPTRLSSGLIQPLQALVDRYQLRFGLQIELQISSDLDAWTTEGTRHAFYRVVQQALDNVVEHARAQRVWIRFWGEDDHIHFQIEDNGIGLPPSAMTTGFGLPSMKARLEMFGGESMTTTKGGGLN